jgi:hypothetical protein
MGWNAVSLVGRTKHSRPPTAAPPGCAVRDDPGAVVYLGVVKPTRTAPATIALVTLAAIGVSAAPTTATTASAAQGAAKASRSIVVTVRGTVGGLTLGASTEAQIISTLGPPEATGSGGFGAPDTPDYDGLGYECSPAERRGLRPAGPEGPPYCRTVYYIDSADGVLGGLWTTSTRYETAHGTRVGMSQHAASTRERKHATVGCESGITETGHGATMYLDVQGGRITKPPHPSSESYRLAGGRVTEILVEARHGAPVGLLFC